MSYAGGTKAFASVLVRGVQNKFRHQCRPVTICTPLPSGAPSGGLCVLLGRKAGDTGTHLLENEGVTCLFLLLFKSDFSVSC